MDMQDIARIGLLFLDGDDVANALIDKVGHTDYDFNCFNRVKATLMKIEKIDPASGVHAIVWVRYATDGPVVIPLIAGSSLPVEGCKRMLANPELRAAFDQNIYKVKPRETGIISHYFPFDDSLGDQAGVLELVIGMAEQKDVSYVDMFVPRREEFVKA